MSKCNCECCQRQAISSNLLIGSGFWARTLSNVLNQNKKMKEILNELSPWAKAITENPKCCEEFKEVLLKVLAL